MSRRLTFFWRCSPCLCYSESRIHYKLRGLHGHGSKAQITRCFGVQKGGGKGVAPSSGTIRYEQINVQFLFLPSLSFFIS